MEQTANLPMNLWIVPAYADAGAKVLEATANGLSVLGAEAISFGALAIEGDKVQTLAVSNGRADKADDLPLKASLSASNQVGHSQDGDGDGTQLRSGLYLVVGRGQISAAEMEQELRLRSRIRGPGRVPAGITMRILQGGTFVPEPPPWWYNSMGPDVVIGDASESIDLSPDELVILGSRTTLSIPTGDAVDVTVSRGSNSATVNGFWSQPDPNKHAICRIKAPTLAGLSGNSVTVEWVISGTTYSYTRTVYNLEPPNSRDCVFPSPLSKKGSTSWDGHELTIGDLVNL